MIGCRPQWMAAVALLACGLFARAQPASPVTLVEPPPGGNGPLLVLLTGVDGVDGVPNHRGQAQAFARVGWLVHVVDGNRPMPDGTATALREVLQRSLSLPELRSKRAALVGCSLGGWIVMAHGNRMPDLVAAAVACYPSTTRAGEPTAFLADPPATVPTLMLAGVKDTYTGCCPIERARALAAAAALPAVRAPLRLVEYAEADHGFVLPAYPQAYRPDDAADALRQALEHPRRANL